MRYEDIFIDFDDTLYDTRGNAELALVELFDHFRLGRYFPTLEAFTAPYWRENVSLWTDYAAGRITRDYLIVERFRRPLACGQGLEPSREFCLEVSDVFLGLCSQKPGVNDGAHEAVDYLRASGYRLHLCSNGFHEVQYKKLRACGMEGKFHSVILSEDAGANKPSPVYFAYALQRSGAKRERTLMIGDNYNTDIVGAQASGIDAMLFNRWEPGWQPPAPVAFTIDSLREIPQIL